MARWDVASFTTASTATTVAVNSGLGLVRFSLSLAGSTASPNTTQASVSCLDVGFSIGSELPVASYGFSAWFQNTSAKVAASSADLAQSRSTGGTLVGSSAVWTGTTISRPTSGVALAAVLGTGDDIEAIRREAAVSTVATTQTADVGGANAAFVIGQSGVSSVANFSFGFACQTSDGTIKQWSIDQSGREGSLAQVTRSASTVSALALHTTNSTAHDVSVSSFKADGLELTVNATDTARAATVSILGLKVPKVDAGKSTVTTNGAGSGQTGFTVTGLGPNVGLVLLASIGSSLQTLQDHNMFSIGFASSNGNQRSVSGFVTQSAGATTRYASYFGTSHAVIFVSGSSNVHPSITAPPAVITKGAFAATTDGFKVTFDSTEANGWHVYWGAFMNVVSDIGGSIQSNFNANAGPKLVDRVGSVIASSFNVNPGVKEVDRVGASIQSSFSQALGLTPDFFPGEGKYHADAEVKVSNAQDASWGLGNGGEEASDRYLTVMRNSSSPDLNKTIDVTTDRTRLGIAEFGNARFLRIVPPSTNTVPLRLSGGRSGQGMQLSSRGETLLSLADRAGSDAYLFTTESTTIPGVRVLLD